jgi:hypothetical protein
VIIIGGVRNTVTLGQIVDQATNIPATLEEQATITVRRTAPDDVQVREIVVKVDGERVCALKYGDSITLPVTSGYHRLRVDNTFNWKTIELYLTPGERRKYLTKSRTGKFGWFLIALLGAGPLYVSIELEA